ncbi:hypothetical protein [uncultured Aquimarina sp.]|nr:hypothetical protein [uncultured Aquimarina sp.]
MKKWILIIGGIILIGIGIKINSDLNDVVEAFNSEHSLNEPNLIILLDSISPNKNYTYYKYKFDKGGLGYSRIFWSVTKIDKNENELEKGLIPNGYKIIGWTDTSGLSLQK